MAKRTNTKARPRKIPSEAALANGARAFFAALAEVDSDAAFELLQRLEADLNHREAGGELTPRYLARWPGLKPEAERAKERDASAKAESDEARARAAELVRSVGGAR